MLLYIRLVIHFRFSGQVDKNHATYSDKQLEDVLEHAFKHTDVNKDGYIDYLEYRVSNYKAKKVKAAQ